MLTNSEMPADAAYAMAGVYLNPGSARSPNMTIQDDEAAVTNENRDRDPETPHAVRAEPLMGKPDQLEPQTARAETRQEALIDEGLEETFPASDPVSAKRIT
ncbi:MAG: hypothetical protein REJ23_10435 [Brevundimonas sp.]|nr:hypothetical protein [Brevundimonas sp.]